LKSGINPGDTLVVGGSEVGLDVAPDVLEVYEVEVERDFILLGDELVFDGVGIIAEADFFVGGVDLVDEGEVEPLPEQLAKGFIIRFEIHPHDIIIQQLLPTPLIPPILCLFLMHSFHIPLPINFIMSYEMKKALRRSAGAKSYA
jgi:hypothetical protein